MKQFLLWIIAIAIMLVAVVYQRATGPTQPFSGTISVNNHDYKYKLLRSHETTKGAQIELPEIRTTNFNGFLHYKRYKTKDSMTVVPLSLVDLKPQEGFLYNWFPSLKREKNTAYAASLPVQPSAGKMEYFVSGNIDEVSFRIPESEEDNIVLRYKDPVPSGVLIPHIFLMFFAVLFGMRAGLSALFEPKSMRKWALISLIGMTIGGMMLGPMVQKYAFGEYWTGFPFGGDFTDNKMLIMWLAWVIALVIVGLKSKKNERTNRVVVLLAAVIMTAVYLIPHSMGGSTLDYDKVDQGIHPTEAIKTGAE